MHTVRVKILQYNVKGNILYSVTNSIDLILQILTSTLLPMLSMLLRLVHA